SNAHDDFAAKPRPMFDASQREGLLAEVEERRAAELEVRVALETARERVRAERARAELLAAQLERERAAADAAARLAVIRRAQLDAASGVSGELPAFIDAVDASVNEAKLRLAAAEAERSKQH